MSSLDKLARQIAELERQVKTLSQPQLGYSSFEEGAIQQYDPAQPAQVVQRIGEQFDGTFVPAILSGPIPPVPTTPTITPVAGGLRVVWDGTFLGGALVPMDFARVEVHVSTDPDFLATTFDTLRTTIETPRGGEVILQLPYVEHYVKLVTRSLSGKASLASAAGQGTPGRIGTSDLAFDLDDIGGNTIHAGEDIPTPPEDGNKIGDLWLKQPENIAHRWDGVDWIQLRDQGVAQALQDAFAAQEAADQAGLAALAAQGDADQALADAAAASSLAQLAKTTADSKVVVYRQASAPTGLAAGDINDLWIDSDDSNKLYAWSGTAWVVSDDQRIATALTSASTAQTTADSKTTLFAQASAPSTTGRTTGDVWLDTDDGNKRYVWTGAWTASPIGATGISATARQLGAITTYRQATAPASGMIVGDFWIDSDDTNKVYRYEGATPTWVAVADTRIATAITNAATAQSTADGKMRIFVQASAPTGLVAGDVGDLWLDSDDGNRPWTWSGTAWADRRFGNGAIQPQSLVARDVIATGTVSAALLESVMVLATTIIAGNANGGHSRMTPTGFYVYAEDPEGGSPYAVARMGTDTNDNFAITDAAGNLKASIDDTGRGNLDDLYVTKMPTFAGRGLQTMLDDLPRGLVAVGQVQAGNQQTASRLGIFDVAFTAMPGRAYDFMLWGGYVVADAANMEYGIQVRYKVGGAAPTVNDPMLFEDIKQHDTGRWVECKGTALWYPNVTVPTTIRLLLTLYVQTNFGGTARLVTGWPGIAVYDRGRAVNFGQVPNTGGGSAAPPVQRHVVEHVASWHQSYRGNGTVRPAGDGLVQGYNSTNGDGKAYAGFPDVTGTLAGATVEKVEIYLYANHWYYNSGGTALLGSHNHTGGPGVWTGNGNSFNSGAWPKPGGRWIDVSGWGAGLKDGSIRGIAVRPSGNTDLTYYGRFDGSGFANPPRLKITYLK